MTESAHGFLIGTSGFVCPSFHFEIANPEILKYKDEILPWLTNRSCVMNSEQDKTIHPVLICMLRNLISEIPEYEYIKDREPYIDEKTGGCILIYPDRLIPQSF